MIGLYQLAFCSKLVLNQGEFNYGREISRNQLFEFEQDMFNM